MVKSLKLIIEALLFASEKPLTARDIHAVLPDVATQEITSALRVLKYEYEALGRSFGLKEVAEAYQFRSHTEYGPYILAMYQSSPSRLSRAALETLAIVAYKQPILRQEIERLRGVDSGGILKMLLEKELIRIVGRKELPGRPLIYGTSKKFLEVFDLKDLDSLPKVKEMKALGSDEPAEPQKPGVQPPLEQEPAEHGQETREETGERPETGPPGGKDPASSPGGEPAPEEASNPGDPLPGSEPQTE
jgi:segregation and condensation protein B